MNSIQSIIEAYIELEQSIRQLMTKLFSNTCGICTACCCRADICEEASQSAFLSLLLERQNLDAGSMDDRYGWLDLHGCSLEYGRPPVCYTYFCDELLARLPDEETRWVTRVLGRLVEYVGENALKEWHLVEISDPDDLQHVDMEAISVRLSQAQQALETIEHYIESGHLSATDRSLLEPIGTPDS